MTIEQKEKFLAAWAAEKASDEAKWLWENPDKVRFNLEVAPGETQFTVANQNDLHTVIQALLDAKIGVEAPFMAVDAVDAVSGYVGTVIVPIISVASPIIVTVLAGWFARSKRIIRFEDGDFKVEAPTIAELHKAIEISQERRARRAAAEHTDKAEQ